MQCSTEMGKGGKKKERERAVLNGNCRTNQTVVVMAVVVVVAQCVADMSGQVGGGSINLT